jgi:hypothetical protein
MIIESNKPIPAAKSGRLKYPLQFMEVGDSITFPGAANDPAEVMRLRGAANVTGKRKGMKFVVRMIGDGVCMWRVK